MKKLYTLVVLFSVGSLTFSYAQKNYQNMEGFTPGTRLVFQVCQSDSFAPGGNGFNKTWNFSYLKSSGDTVTENMVEPKTVAGYEDYSGATLVEKYSNGNRVFLKKKPHQTWLIGFTNTKSKITINYPHPVLIALRPISYQDSDSANYTSTFSAHGMKFTGTGKSVIHADGFGTLILPDKTYKNVLRIKIVQTETDLLKQYHSTSTTVTTTYAWFDKTHHSALLKMTESESNYYSKKSIQYLLSETTFVE